MRRYFLPVICAFITLLLCPIAGFSQVGVNYNDVGVIVNLDDPGSQEIAAYFMSKRNIPASNLIPVHVPATEEITHSEFQSYLSQVESYLTTQGLSNSLNYLVTTKGCPLKVLREANDSMGCNSSVESELMLIPPTYHGNIGSCLFKAGGYINNPYYSYKTNFTQGNYLMYLVTRLDGYSVQEVKNMIDNSGPNRYADKDSALFVLDQSPNWAAEGLNQAFAIIADTLTNRGWHVNLNTDSTFAINQRNVQGYASWGSNDGFADHYTTNAIPHNTWAKAAIAETHVSTSGRSFQPGTTYGQSLIADLLKEGCAGAKGYVYEPFTIAIARSLILFDRYTDLQADGAPKYNLAESYFMASPLVSWMDVVIGDPKTSITTNSALANVTPVKDVISMLTYPNPATETTRVTATWKQPSAASLTLYDMAGKQVWHDSVTVCTRLQRDINLSHLTPGIYTLKILADGLSSTQKIAVVK